jgi:2-octaprenyl-6-methoxyphenol hydroxylase
VFGWNIPLALLLPALETRCLALGVDVITANVNSARLSGDVIEVESGAGSYAARLAIAADGRKSIMREAAGISCRNWTYDQVAIATSFDHSAAHGGISTEYHRTAGPFTTVPLKGNRSSLVWLERPARAAQLMELTDRDLAKEIQLASRGELGLVSGIGPRKTFPMQGLIANSFAAKRTMLIGETAHVVPPIGAQGLNMSLRDGAQAAELISGHSDPGAAGILQEYDLLRRRDVLPRQQMIDLMNRSLLSGLLPMEMARAVGLDVLGRFAPLRRFVMRRGLGPVSSLPRVMQPRGSNADMVA